MKDIDIIDAEIDDISENVKNLPNTISSKETKLDISNLEGIIDLEVLLEDYQTLRTTVLSTTEISKKILADLTQQLMYGDEFSPEIIESFSSLVKTTNSSIKLLTDSYKNIATILMNIKRLNSDKTKEEINIENVNIYSTADIVKKLKNLENN